MEARCVCCRKTMMQVAGGFYQLRDGFICKEDYQSAPEQYSSLYLYDLFEDIIIRNFSSIERTLKSLEESGLYTQSVNWMYQQVVCATVYRIWEMYTEYIERQERQQAVSEVNEHYSSPEEEKRTEADWKCPHCGHENPPRNPICYSCRNAPDCEDPVMPQTALDNSFLKLMATYAFQTLSLFWTCVRCGNNNIPKTKHACDCGFVNLLLVSSEVPESPPPPAPVAPQASFSNPCWKCTCGYEYTLKTDRFCTRCKMPQPVASDSASDSAPVQPVTEEIKNPSPEDSSSAPQWTCADCGLAENKEADHVCKCEKSHEPAEHPKCAKCRLRETSGASDICETCKVITSARLISTGRAKCSGCGGLLIRGQDCQKCKKAPEPPKSLPITSKFWNCACGRNNRPVRETCEKCSRPRPLIFCNKNCGAGVNAVGDVCPKCTSKWQSSISRQPGAGRGKNSK